MRKIILACVLATAALVHAAYPPQDPSASLDALLRDIWTQGAKIAYKLYQGKTTVPMSAPARQAFAADMLRLAESSNLAGIALQKSKNYFYPKTHLPGPQDFDGAYFVHFIRPDFKGDAIQERIYINVHPDHAAEVMKFIVEMVLKPGIMEAKTAAPDGLETRADGIVIYAVTLADVDSALALLAEYQGNHRDHFLADLPAATRPRLIGISTAAQPTAALKSESFGSYMASCAQTAMAEQPPPADFADFRKRVRAVMTADGVDPDHPDRLTRRP